MGDIKYMKEAILFVFFINGFFTWGFFIGKQYAEVRTLSTEMAIQDCEAKLSRDKHCIAKVVAEVYVEE